MKHLLFALTSLAIVLGVVLVAGCVEEPIVDPYLDCDSDADCVEQTGVLGTICETGICMPPVDCGSDCTWPPEDPYINCSTDVDCEVLPAPGAICESDVCVYPYAP